MYEKLREKSNLQTSTMEDTQNHNPFNTSKLRVSLHHFATVLSKSATAHFIKWLLLFMLLILNMQYGHHQVSQLANHLQVLNYAANSQTLLLHCRNHHLK